MARVTYALVGAALVALILGIFVYDDSNTWLFVSIGLSVACIGLVVFGAARRASQSGPTYAASPIMEIPGDEDVDGDVSAFEAAAAADDDEYEDFDDLEDLDDLDDELFADDDDDEVAAPAPRANKKAAPKKAVKKAPAKKTAAKKSSAKKTAAKSAGKVVVVEGRDKYHLADCRFAQNADEIKEITLASAKRGGYSPCGVCKPS